MKLLFPLGIGLLVLLCWSLVQAVPQNTLQLLQPLIDATPINGTLRLAAGTYQGPAHIDHTMTMESDGTDVIQGDRRDRKSTRLNSSH